MDSPIGKQIVAGVEGLAKEELRKVKMAADKKGLGGVLNTGINIAEQQIGADLDGDGDVGK